MESKPEMTTKIPQLPDEILNMIFEYAHKLEFAEVLEEIECGNDNTRCDCCMGGINRTLIFGRCECICSNCGDVYAFCRGNCYDDCTEYEDTCKCDDPECPCSGEKDWAGYFGIPDYSYNHYYHY